MAVERLADGCDVDGEHSRLVTRLALALFDQLPVLHGLGPAARDLLHAAARLHDIGRSRVDGAGHEVESLRIILEASELAAWDERDRLIVGSVARYHTRDAPSPEHGHFAALAPGDRELVRRLAALLRLADGLDRGHRADVGALVASAGPDGVRILLLLRRALDPERRAALLARAVEKGRLFEYVYGKRLILRAVGG